MPGSSTQWDRYVAAYDVAENARQAFVDKMRSINLGGQFDAEELQRAATELQRLFADMTAAAMPIVQAGNSRPGVRTELAVA